MFSTHEVFLMVILSPSKCKLSFILAAQVTKEGADIYAKSILGSKVMLIGFLCMLMLVQQPVSKWKGHQDCSIRTTKFIYEDNCTVIIYRSLLIVGSYNLLPVCKFWLLVNVALQNCFLIIKWQSIGISVAYAVCWE